MSIVLHPISEKHLASVTHHLPQSLLLSGKRGIGLSTLAHEIAGKQLASVLRPQDKKEQTDNENSTISVEMIRQLYEQTRAKRSDARVIIIDDADRMSRGAAAAFLKLLEEPSEHTHFILTSHAPQLLPATILSRVQELTLQPLSSDQTKQYLTALGINNPTKRMQLQFIADGLPAEIMRLHENDDYFQKKAAIMGDARTLLQATPYDKLLIVQKYHTNRDTAIQLIDSALTIARHSLSAKPQPTLVNQLEQLVTVREHLAANFSVRLQLVQLVV
jgi:replication-associated recombination protein RarA